MTAPVADLDPDTGKLSLSDGAFEVLEQLAGGGRVRGGDSGVTAQLAALRSASVLDSAGGFHPSLAATRAAIGHAIAQLVLSDGERVARTWVTPTLAALLLPAPTQRGLRRLTCLPVSMIPDAIARVVELGPRPFAAAAEPVPLATLPAGGPRIHWRLTGRRRSVGEP